MAKTEGKNGGHGTPRLAIRRGGVDVARLMLGTMENGKLDVKVSFLSHPFVVYTYPLLHINPDILVPEASEGKNITYHHGSDGKDVVIHLKNELAGEGEPRYKSLPLHRILPPSTDTVVPLPLLKLELPQVLESQGPKSQKQKKRPGKQVVDIDADCDVVEIFMTSREWSINDMQSMLPDLMGVMLSTPFEAWASNVITVNQSKVAAIPHGEGKCRLIGVKFDNVDLVVLQYPQPFMPAPEVIRATFIENELAEPIMLHMQTSLTKDGNHCLTRCPKLDDILMPDFMRAINLKCQDVWARALRFGSVTSQKYELFTHRINQKRLDLVQSIRTREGELESAIIEVQKSFDSVAGDEDIRSAEDSFSRHMVLAQKTGALPAVIHSTRLSCESLGIDETYAFLTIGDLDVHNDIGRLCDLVGIPAMTTAMRTEGRPFEDGLAGLRTRLQLMGYRCSVTTTFALLEPESPGGRPVAVPLYEREELSGQYRNLPGNEKKELRGMVEDDLRAALSRPEGNLSLGAGLYVLDITPFRKADGNVSHRTRVAGQIGEESWDIVSRPVNSFIAAYKGVRYAYLELNRWWGDFLTQCSKENVALMVREGRSNDVILNGAETAVVRLGVTFGRLLAPIAGFLQTEVDPEKLGEIPNADLRQARCFAFFYQLTMYALNSDGVFGGVMGDIGAGVWLGCDKRRMQAWDGWSEGNLKFLESIAENHFDLEQVAVDACRFASALYDWALYTRSDELTSVCARYGGVRDEYGIKGDMVVFRVHEDVPSGDVIFADRIDLKYLRQAINDFEVVRQCLIP